MSKKDKFSYVIMPIVVFCLIGAFAGVVEMAMPIAAAALMISTIGIIIMMAWWDYERP